MSRLRDVIIANILLEKPDGTRTLDKDHCVLGCDAVYFSLAGGEILSSVNVTEFADHVI
jgi:hypothetical protein